MPAQDLGTALEIELAVSLDTKAVMAINPTHTAEIAITCCFWLLVRAASVEKALDLRAVALNMVMVGRRVLANIVNLETLA